MIIPDELLPHCFNRDGLALRPARRELPLVGQRIFVFHGGSRVLDSTTRVEVIREIEDWELVTNAKRRFSINSGGCLDRTYRHFRACLMNDALDALWKDHRKVHRMALELEEFRFSAAGFPKDITEQVYKLVREAKFQAG